MADAIFSDRECAVAKPPEKISTVEWGKRHRELSILTSASAGRWTPDMIPFMVPVLDSLDDPDIEKVVMQKSSQIAGTESFLTWLAKCADQDPAPAMLCFADEDTADEIMERRVQPLIRTAAPLAKLIDESKFAKKGITLLNNFSLVPAWASSIAKTASRPIRYLYLSEITKPGYGKLGDEGSVLTRIFQRTETFPNKKIAIETTPTVENDNIAKQMSMCDVIYDWHVPCPHCGVFQVLRFRQTKYRNSAGVETTSGSVVWEQNDDIRIAAESARYQCGDCQAMWTSAEKNVAVSNGAAFPRTEIIKKPRSVGYHVSRLYSLFPGGRLESLVLAFLHAKDDVNELQSFCNNVLAEHWTARVQERQPDEIAHCRTDLAKGIVPDQAVVLTAGVDTQQHGFWYSVRAWGSDNTSWLVDFGYLPTWQELDELLFATQYKTLSGNKSFGIWRALIDSGGTKHVENAVSRTEEVYQWVRKNGVGRGCRVFAAKGSSTSLQGNVMLGNPIDKTPSGKSMAGGIQLVFCDTDKLKDALWWAIDRAKEHEHGAAYIYQDAPAEYVKQILAEEKRRNRDGSTSWVQIRKDNHALDTECLCRAAADWGLLGGIRPFQNRAQQQQQPAQPPQPGQPPAPAAPPPAHVQKQPIANPYTKNAQRPGVNPYTRRF